MRIDPHGNYDKSFYFPVRGNDKYQGGILVRVRIWSPWKQWPNFSFLSTKGFKLVWWCHQLLSGFLVKGHLLLVLRQSRLSVNDKDDNEMIRGCAQNSLGLRKTLHNLSWKTVDEGFSIIHRLKWGPLPPNDCRITQHVREREERKEEMTL